MIQSNVMKRLSKIMINRSMYIEDMHLIEFMEEMSTAINTTAKMPVTANGLMSVWKQKGPDSLRTKLQSLARRKRGQWASIAKSYLELTFLPHQPLPIKKTKGRKGEDEDDDEGCADDDSMLSSAMRVERFEAGLVYQIVRSTLPNGACCLSVSKSNKRTSDRCVHYHTFPLYISHVLVQIKIDRVDRHPTLYRCSWSCGNTSGHCCGL